jgi:hypothetical protein
MLNRHLKECNMQIEAEMRCRRIALVYQEHRRNEDAL